MFGTSMQNYKEADDLQHKVISSFWVQVYYALYEQRF